MKLVLGVAVGITVILVAVFLRLDSSSSGEKYPANVESNFLRACELNGASDICQCQFDWWEENVSFEEFEAIEREASTTGELPDEFLDAVEACIKM